MIDWDSYYDMTRSRGPRSILFRALCYMDKAGLGKETAVDIGAGSGRDLPLLSENFNNVIAIEPNSSALRDLRGIASSRENIRIVEDGFQAIVNLEPSLISMNSVIPFIPTIEFEDVWQHLRPSRGTMFSGDFWGLQHTWARTRTDIVFYSREKILKFFEKSWEIREISERLLDRLDTHGRKTLLHRYEIVAQAK